MTTTIDIEQGCIAKVWIMRKRDGSQWRREDFSLVQQCRMLDWPLPVEFANGEAWIILNDHGQQWCDRHEERILNDDNSYFNREMPNVQIIKKFIIKPIRRVRKATEAVDIGSG